MAHSIVGQLVNRENFGDVLRFIHHECRYTPTEIDAIDHAALNLEACSWEYDGEMLIIEPAGAQFKRYHVAYDGCDCNIGVTGDDCWHMTAFRLIQRAAEYSLTSALRQHQSIHVDCDVVV